MHALAGLHLSVKWTLAVCRPLPQGRLDTMVKVEGAAVGELLNSSAGSPARSLATYRSSCCADGLLIPLEASLRMRRHVSLLTSSCFET
jgi:hypothetical protein